MKSLDVGNVIYLKKDEDYRLTIVKGVVLEINSDQITLKDDDNQNFYWYTESNEIVIKRFMFNRGKFSIIEDAVIGEQLYIKSQLINTLEIMGYELSSCVKKFSKNKISLDQISVLQDLDSMIDKYHKSRNKFIEYLSR